MHWNPTRHAGLNALEDFLSRAKDYASERNYDRGPQDRRNVSRLSPYLRHRLVTEEETWHRVLQRHPFSKVEKFLQEVVWRTYWKGWLERSPGVWDEWIDSLPAARNSPGIEEARSGRTGIGPFDAWARELVEHNYLHNHARMWFASIWIFTLKLPWQAGAEFFLEHLVDGDPASNTLGWRWVAGIQTRGKHYLARASNIRRYTEGRLDPGTALNEEAEPIPAADPPAKIDPDLPAPVSADPPTAGDGLFLTTDDLAPETLFAGRSFTAIAGGRPEDPGHSVIPEAKKVAEFRREAVRANLERVADTQGRPGTRIGENLPHSLIAWAKQERLSRIWISHPPVGPTRDPVRRLSKALAEAGLATRWFARTWDRELHPCAKAGFFRFRKEAFPKLLEKPSTAESASPRGTV